MPSWVCVPSTDVFGFQKLFEMIYSTARCGYTGNGDQWIVINSQVRLMCSVERLTKWLMASQDGMDKAEWISRQLTMIS